MILQELDLVSFTADQRLPEGCSSKGWIMHRSRTKPHCWWVGVERGENAFAIRMPETNLVFEQRPKQEVMNFKS